MTTEGGGTEACFGTEAVWGIYENLAMIGQPITKHIQKSLYYDVISLHKRPS